MNEVTVENVKTFEDLKSQLNIELNKAAISFVRIGYLLKTARDTDILKDTEYNDVNDFAAKEFGLDRSQVSRFMRINDRFSISGYSEQLKVEYEGYGSAKLSLMLTLPDEINEELSPEYSKSDIQAIKEEYEEEQKISPIEVMTEEIPEDEPDEFIAQITKQLNDEHHEPINNVHWGIEHGVEIDEEDIKDAYMPAGDCTYNIRVAGQGRFMVNCKSEQITIVSMRDPGNKTTLSWTEFTKATLEDAKTRDFSTKEESTKPKEKPKKVEKSQAAKKEKPKKEEPKAAPTARQPEETAETQSKESNEAAGEQEIMPKPVEDTEAAGEEEHIETEEEKDTKAAGDLTAFERQICNELGSIITEISSPLKPNWGHITDRLRDTIRMINSATF